MSGPRYIGDYRYGPEDTDKIGHYLVGYGPAAFAALPWGDDQFNCVIAVVDDELGRDVGPDIARQVVRQKVDWVRTAGACAKWMHDLVDECSVDCGRQKAVGYGDPMTSWHENATSLLAIADLAINAMGGVDHELTVLIGSTSDVERLAEFMRETLEAENRRESQP